MARMDTRSEQAQGGARILMVDDDPGICDVVSDFLGKHGYAVECASDAREMEQALEKGPVDLIVLDVMLPGEDGLAICRRMAVGDAPPIIMLSAMGEDTDRIVGLELGADDYLAKPFEPEELLLRIQAILRRSGDRPVPQGVLTLGRCQFDVARGELTCGGEPVRLTEGEQQLLRTLARSPHEPVDRLELARDTVDPSGRAVDVQVTRLRRKIEADPKAPRYLQTVRGVGYMLAPD